MPAEQKYLDYLDKEMTIMGLLSTFCVAVIALVLDRTLGAEPSKKTLFSDLWHKEQTYVVLGSMLFAVAAAYFYKQRSALAWFYGQIALSLEAPSTNNIPSPAWYKDADSWATWVPYQIAFTALGIGSVLYGIALLEVSGTRSVPAWLIWTGICVTGVVQSIRLTIYRRHKYEDNPIRKVFPFVSLH